MELSANRNYIKGSGAILSLKLGEKGGNVVTRDCSVGMGLGRYGAPESVCDGSGAGDGHGLKAVAAACESIVAGRQSHDVFRAVVGRCSAGPHDSEGTFRLNKLIMFPGGGGRAIARA